MSKVFFLVFLIFSRSLYAGADTEVVMEKIWYNESKCSYEKLVWWNEGEEFMSLGIGHFIWFPKGCIFPFTETFPELLNYLKEQGIALPLWLEQANGCPWGSRKEFQEALRLPQVEELRRLLYQTRFHQADFIVRRFNRSFSKLLEETPIVQKEKIAANFHRLEKEPRGLFAMIDYIHFKGEGTDPKERYQGQGWGLLQVLVDMPEQSKGDSVLEDFVVSAKRVLEQRVKNSPLERHEEKWLAGWQRRVEAYLH